MSRIAVAPLLLLLLLTTSTYSQEVRSEKHQETAAGETDNSQRQEIGRALSTLQTSNTVLLEALRAMHAQGEAQAEQERTRYNGWCSPSVIVEFLLFLVGCAYTYFAWRQWGAIRTQARIANDALIAAKMSAEAARDGVAIGWKNHHLAYRPWIVTDKMQMISGLDFDKPGEPLQFEIHLINCGATPALKIKATIDWHPLPPSAPPPTAPSYRARAEIFEIGIIGPTRPFRCVASLDNDPELDPMNVFMLKAEVLYIYGRIEYFGSFDLIDPYVTCFCYRKDPENNNAFTMVGPYISGT